MDPIYSAPAPMLDEQLAELLQLGDDETVCSGCHVVKALSGACNGGCD